MWKMELPIFLSIILLCIKLKVPFLLINIIGTDGNPLIELKICIFPITNRCSLLFAGIYYIVLESIYKRLFWRNTIRLIKRSFFYVVHSKKKRVMMWSWQFLSYTKGSLYMYFWIKVILQAKIKHPYDQLCSL